MNPILEVRGLTKRFGGLTAVHDLDFDVREGEILGMIGPNGAGKSTTFNLIAGTYPATTGDVRYAGERLLGLPPHRIAARGVMRTFQHNRPFAGMRVVENVLALVFGLVLAPAVAARIAMITELTTSTLLFLGLGHLGFHQVVGVYHVGKIGFGGARPRIFLSRQAAEENDTNQADSREH